MQPLWTGCKPILLPVVLEPALNQKSGDFLFRDKALKVNPAGIQHKNWQEYWTKRVGFRDPDTLTVQGAFQ